MDSRFSDPKLKKLYTEGKGARAYEAGVVDKFLLRIRTIEAAKDKRDLRVPASVHFEHLSGEYAGSRSMKLKGRWRLILRIVAERGQKVVVVDEISNHYGD